MGNNKSDFFTSEPTSQFVDSLPYQFIWIDRNISNNYNEKYLKQLRKNIPIKSCQSLQQLRTIIDQTKQTQGRVIIVSSAGMGDDTYQYVQGCAIIYKMILFASHRPKAQQLIQSYGKISTAVFSFNNLKKQLALLQQEYRQQMLFLRPNTMPKLNCWITNWRVLLQQSKRDIGKADFIQYCKKWVIQKELSIYFKNYNLAKILQEKDNMVLQWLGKQNFFFSIPAQLLLTCQNPFKLAFVRQPVADIFSVIKSHYNSTPYEINRLYVRIPLSHSQFDLVKSFKQQQPYFYFGTFQRCGFAQDISPQETNQFDFQLSIPKKDSNRQCNGYWLNQKKFYGLINLGNPFKITKVVVAQKAGEKNKIFAELVMLLKTQNIQKGGQHYSLQMHSRFISYMIESFPGQVLCSHYSNHADYYQQFSRHEINNLLSVSSSNPRTNIFQRQFKSKALKLCLKSKNNQQLIKSYVQLRQKIKKVVTQTNQYKPNSLRIYVAEAQLYFLSNDLQRMAKSLRKVKEYNEELKGSQEDQTKVSILSIYQSIATDSNTIFQMLGKLDSIKRQYEVKKGKNGSFSSVSTLAILVKAHGYAELRRCEQCNSLLDELMEISLLCEGQNSNNHNFLNDLKAFFAEKQRLIEEKIKKSKRDFKTNLESLEFGLIQIKPIDFRFYQ